MSVLFGLEPFQKFGVGGGGLVVGGWWWSKDILEFRFGPNLGIKLEAWTKLNKSSLTQYIVIYVNSQHKNILWLPR